jgi:3-mercaptopyruvate sulfurtransferase SseA
MDKVKEILSDSKKVLVDVRCPAESTGKLTAPMSRIMMGHGRNGETWSGTQFRNLSQRFHLAFLTMSEADRRNESI